MNTEDYQNELISVFYGESSLSVIDIARKYELPLENCQKDFGQLQALSERFQHLPEYRPSPVSLNKIIRHAREKVSQPPKKSFWAWFWQPAFSLAGFAMVGFLVFYVVQNSDFWHQKDEQVAVLQNSVPVSRFSQRLLSTPLDNYPLERKNTIFNNVSLGKSSEEFSFDDGLESQFLSKNPTSRELELLFFRARKLEKLGYFREALNDYQLIEKFSSDVAYQKTVPLAIARCYEKLGRKDQAISILEEYKQTFGGTDDIRIWMDQLKSETF